MRALLLAVQRAWSSCACSCECRVWLLFPHRRPFVSVCRYLTSPPIVSAGNHAVVVGTYRGVVAVFDLRFQLLVAAWRLSSRAPVTALYPYTTKAKQAAFPVDAVGGSPLSWVFGKQLACGVASGDGEVTFWNLETGAAIVLLRVLPTKAAEAAATRAPFLTRIPTRGNRIVPCRALSCPVACVMSCQAPGAVSDCVGSSRFVLCRDVSCRVVSCRVVSCRVVSCRVVSCRVVSCRAMCRQRRGGPLAVVVVDCEPAADGPQVCPCRGGVDPAAHCTHPLHPVPATHNRGRVRWRRLRSRWHAWHRCGAACVCGGCLRVR